MKNNNRRKFHIILTICMAVIVILMDMLFFILPDRESSETENRNLQQFPKLTWNTVTQGRFETQFDDYIADQFPMRDMWTGAATTVRRFAGNTESNRIFLGKDGYLIQRFDAPAEDEYQSVKNSITDTAHGHYNLNIYAMIIPTAVSIMNDHLPAGSSYLAGDENALIDRLNADMLNSGITVIDVREILAGLRDSGTQVYYRTDHHWTTDAAYAAYQAFAAVSGSGTAETAYERLLVTDSFQGTLSASSGFRTGETDKIYVYLSDYDAISPNDENTVVTGDETGAAGYAAVAIDDEIGAAGYTAVAIDDEIGAAGGNDHAAQDGRTGTAAQHFYTVTNMDTGEKRASLYDTSFLETRDKYAVFLGGNHGELKIQTTSSSERSILVIKDSYANCFIPFMIPDFRTIIVIDPRYYLGDLDQIISDEDITDILFLYNAETL